MILAKKWGIFIKEGFELPENPMSVALDSVYIGYVGMDDSERVYVSDLGEDVTFQDLLNEESVSVVIEEESCFSAPCSIVLEEYDYLCMQKFYLVEQDGKIYAMTDEVTEGNPNVGVGVVLRDCYEIKPEYQAAFMEAFLAVE